MKHDIMTLGLFIRVAWLPNVIMEVVNSQPLFGDFNLFSETSKSCLNDVEVVFLKKAPTDWSFTSIQPCTMIIVNTMDCIQRLINDISDYNRPTTLLAIGVA